MAYGRKTGGRQKGTLNKLTVEMKAARAQLLARTGEVLGDKMFDGDSLSLLQCTYKNGELPLDVRLHAAVAAIRFERPAMAQSTVDLNVTAVRADQLSDDDLAQIIARDAKALPAPSDEPVLIEIPNPDALK